MFKWSDGPVFRVKGPASPNFWDPILTLMRFDLQRLNSEDKYVGRAYFYESAAPHVLKARGISVPKISQDPVHACTRCEKQ